jgi:hypothetical protein
VQIPTCRDCRESEGVPQIQFHPLFSRRGWRAGRAGPDTRKEPAIAGPRATPVFDAAYLGIRTIRYLRVPRGVSTRNSCPADLLMRAFPTGDLSEILPSRELAS